MVKIRKASGEIEEFKRAKFCSSLRKAGAPRDVVARVCSQVESELRSEISTQAIFRKAATYLAKEHLQAAARYRLKEGMLQLGPAGFLFEQYVEGVLQAHGYRTKRNRMMRGHCVSHEIDIIAYKGNEHFLIEAKYRNEKGIKTDIQTVMYMYARLLDIERAQKLTEKENAIHKAWLITNTKFTSKAIRYANCMGIGVTGWDAPQHTSLEDMISKEGLYPVTVLQSVNQFAREQFAKANLIFAKDLINYTAEDFEQKFSIRKRNAQQIVSELKRLYNV